MIFATLWDLLVKMTLFLLLRESNQTEVPKDQRKSDYEVVQLTLGRSANLDTIWRMLLFFRGRTEYQRGKVPNRGEPRKPDQSIAFYILISIFFATAIYCGGKIAGTMFPARLLIGNVAPVKASAELLFYPDMANMGPHSTENARINGIQAQSALAALGAVNDAMLVWKGKVFTHSETIPADNSTYPDDTGIRFTYGYNLTGADLGLQFASQLHLTVNGTCETKYEWLMPLPYDGSNITDNYTLWPGQDYNTSSHVNKGPTRSSFPVAGFYEGAFPNDTSESTYAIVYGTAHSHSITNSTDPWFATEGMPSSEKPLSRFNETQWVRDRRPPLSCSEYAIWEYRGNYASTANFSSIPGLPVSAVLQEVITTATLAPILSQIGFILQQAALLSRFTYTSGVIDANASELAVDMEHLAWAAYVFTRGMVVDTTVAPTQRLQLTTSNIFLYKNGTLREGSGDFVLTSKDVTTISLHYLIAIPLFFVALTIVNALAWSPDDPDAFTCFLKKVLSLCKCWGKNHYQKVTEESSTAP
ncbi:hypothetical protein RUND412_011307 [Rhizina undulata]